jgi:DNA-binding NarL/FixJ family response regulator
MVDDELGPKETAPPSPDTGVLTYVLPKIHLPIREAGTVRLIALGKTHAQIAEEFQISKATVDQRKKRAMQRLGVTNTAQLIHYAIAASLVDLGETA